ncbi:MAG: NAD(P)/FAD-dependent oxidoreductase [Clostridia bacterium]|nr:NAD(P)/FAD-dependent oxidoreductase [Clostridia bacterium]
MTSTKRVLVVGGGAAGMLAAGTALRAGAEVTVLEHKDRTLLKVGITGKGRCNLTNNCQLNELIENVVHNPRFLYTAFSAFSPEDVMALFEELGVPLKTERGRRVFPVSDKASDVVRALRRYAAGATVLEEHARALVTENGRVKGVLGKTLHEADAVILATGGRSYPVTGSDGSGYALAREAGHTVTPLSPSLVPLTSPSPLCPMMQGLSLKNVRLRVLSRDGGKPLYEDFGEMMFTHFGVTGPMILSASAHLQGRKLDTLVLEIDLKPALDEGTLDARLLSDFAKNANRNFENALGGLLPAKMIEAMLLYTGISGTKKVNLITKEERRTLLRALKGFTVPLSGFRPIEEAVITSGGVAVKEIDPKTMMSKLCAGLFFAGEMIDTDAYTGGYNLQIAFSTGHLAGKSAAEYILEDETDVL